MIIEKRCDRSFGEGNDLRAAPLVAVVAVTEEITVALLSDLALEDVDGAIVDC